MLLAKINIVYFCEDQATMMTETPAIRPIGPHRSGSWSKRFTLLMLLVVGLASPLAGGAGALLTIEVFALLVYPVGSVLDPQLAPLYLNAALAALLVGPFFWWLWILRPRRLSPGRGAWVGVVGSLVAHPLTWLLLVGTTALADRTTASHPIPADLSGFPAALVFVVNSSGVSLLFAGWFTALLGGLAGAGVAWGLTFLAERDQRRT
jgi:hypothetical protein